jgi:hypothetical protein
MNDLLRLKGRKKAPIKRYYPPDVQLLQSFTAQGEYLFPNIVDDEDIIKSTLLATKASEMEMTVPDEPVWVSSYKECMALLREVDNLRKDSIMLRNRSPRRKRRRWPPFGKRGMIRSSNNSSIRLP